MSWIVVGVAGAGLVAGVLNNQQQTANRKKEMMANAAAEQNSPWTGMQTQTMGMNTPSAVGAGLQGATAGAMMGSQFGKASAAPSTPTADAMTQPQVGDAYAQNRQGTPGNPYGVGGNFKY